MDANLSLIHTLRWTGIQTVSGGTCNYFRVYHVAYVGTTSATTLRVSAGTSTASPHYVFVENGQNYCGVYDTHYGVRIPGTTIHLETATGFDYGVIVYNTEV